MSYVKSYAYLPSIWRLCVGLFFILSLMKLFQSDPQNKRKVQGNYHDMLMKLCIFEVHNNRQIIVKFYTIAHGPKRKITVYLRFK